MTNSNTYSQTGVWKQGLRPVSRVALIPIFAYIKNNLYRSMETLYANVFCLHRIFIYANYVGMRATRPTDFLILEAFRRDFILCQFYLTVRWKQHPTDFLRKPIDLLHRHPNKKNRLPNSHFSSSFSPLNRLRCNDEVFIFSRVYCSARGRVASF